MPCRILLTCKFLITLQITQKYFFLKYFTIKSFIKRFKYSSFGLRSGTVHTWKKMKMKYLIHIVLTIIGSVSASNTKVIIRGDKAVLGQFPSVVFIFTSDGEDENYMCGGTCKFKSSYKNLFGGRV